MNTELTSQVGQSQLQSVTGVSSSYNFQYGDQPKIKLMKYYAYIEHIRQFVERRIGKSIVQHIRQLPFLSAKLVKEKILYQKYKDREYYNNIHKQFRDVKSHDDRIKALKQGLGGGELDNTEVRASLAIENIASHEDFFLQQISINGELINKVRNEQVLAFERKRDVTTLDKTFKKILQTLAADYKQYNLNNPKAGFVYDYDDTPK